MGGRWTALVLVAGLLVSGCTDTSKSKDVAADVPDMPAARFDVTQPLLLPNDASGCLEVAAGVFVSMADAQRSLPPGFRAADAQTLLGTPVPVGRAMVLLTTAICKTSLLDPAGYSEASTAITIQAPNVAGQRSAASNLYEVARGTDSPNHTELLKAVGWNHVGSLVENRLSMSSSNGVTTSANGGGSVKDAAGPVYAFTLTGVPVKEVPINGTFRWWQALPVGVGYFDYAFSTKAYGGAVSCTIRAGSPAHKVLGTTTCPPESVGFMTPGISAKVAFQLLPGAKAT